MKVIDPVCKMTIEEEDAVATSSYKGKKYHFCSLNCKKSFDRNPESYVGKRADDEKKGGEGFKTTGKWTSSGPYPFLIGIAAALGVVGFYLSLLTLTADWNNAKTQFAEYRWWIIALSVGLGIQATMFSFLRKQLQRMQIRAAKSSLAASGGISTTAMAACCAHYLVPLLPALGLPFLSAAVAGIAEYQFVFFLLGVLSNLFGIGFMLRLMNRNGIIKIPIFKAIKEESK